MTILLNEFKPRKTKYGFSTSLNAYNILDVCALITDTIGKPDADNDVDWYMELKAGGYSSGVELKLYINDLAIYNALMASSLVKAAEPKVKK